MIAVVLLRGIIGSRAEVRDTFKHLKLNKKNACVLVEDTPVVRGMLHRAKDFIAFGDVTDETADKIRAISTNGTAHLHPPRGGMRSIKKAYTNGGDLGDRPDMDDLVRRMLP